MKIKLSIFSGNIGKFISLKSITKRKKTIFLLLLLLIGGYLIYTKFKKEEQISYVLTKVSKDNLQVTISGSGYVTSESQLQLKSKVGGKIVYLGVKNGDYLKKGDLILKIDDTEAQKLVKDAEISLENAKLSLEKIKKPIDKDQILQAQSLLEQTKEEKRKTEDDLISEYENSFIKINQVFKDIPDIIERVKNDLFVLDISKQYVNIDYFAELIRFSKPEVIPIRDNVYIYYKKTKNDFNKSFDLYKNLNKNSSYEDIEETLNLTSETVKNLSETLKNAINVLESYRNFILESKGTGNDYVYTLLDKLNNYLTTINTHVTNLTLSKNNISQLKNSLNLADQDIQFREEQLNKLLRGADELDIKMQELSVKQKENDLLNAKRKLEDYYIYSPLSGYIGQINIKNGEEINAGTVVGIITSREKIAEISLNEIDLVKVKTGQMVMLTLDAVPDKKYRGRVVEIDPIGSVDQGVVNYKVKIIFENPSPEIKDGMSVDAEIITERKENVLLVPNQAIKNLRNQNYVEMVLDDINFPQNRNQLIINYQPKTERRFIKTGLANDEFTEVVSGLKENDIIILRSSGGSKNNINQQRNIFQFGGPGQLRGIRSSGIRQ